MNTRLFVLLIIPLLVLAEQTPPQNINDLGLWLQKWQIQEAEHLNELSEYLNDLSTTGGRVATLIGILVDLNNGTNQQNTLLQEDIETLKGRLAVAAIFSSVYMILSTLCMTVYLVVFLKECVRKHQHQRREEEVELMDQKLQERRERRRAAARAKSSSPRQQ